MSSADVGTTENIPKSRRLVDDILTSLASHAAEIPEERHGLSDRSSRSATQLFEQEALKPHFLTLHLLFPHLLLDALDLLDRGLVVRLRVRLQLQNESSSLNPAAQEQRYYYVRSAQVDRQGRNRSSMSGVGPEAYQVQLTAWSCSCAAFAFTYAQASAYSPDDSEHNTERPYQLRSNIPVDGKVYQGFGGLHALLQAQDEIPPVCKHLLACTLAETCGEFFGVSSAHDSDHDVNPDEPHPGVVEYDVSPSEAAGWAAG